MSVKHYILVSFLASDPNEYWMNCMAHFLYDVSVFFKLRDEWKSPNCIFCLQVFWCNRIASIPNLIAKHVQCVITWLSISLFQWTRFFVLKREKKQQNPKSNVIINVINGLCTILIGRTQNYFKLIAEFFFLFSSFFFSFVKTKAAAVCFLAATRICFACNQQMRTQIIIITKI